MPLTPVMAGTGAVSAAAHPKSLFVGGLDVVKDPAGAYAVPIDSVSLTEAGPDGVSSLTFVIEDYLNSVVVQDGAVVDFHDNTRDVPLFLGYVEAYTVEPAFGDTGRRWTVNCVGIEAVLDWAKVTTALTFAAGGFGPGFQVQAVLANAEGLGPIRAFQNPSAGGQSNQATPMTGDIGAFGYANPDAITIAVGTTVREAIRTICANYTSLNSFGNLYFATVDFYAGLRLWIGIDTQPIGGSVGKPTDYTTFSYTNTGGGAPTENLGFDVDVIGIIRGVLVLGGGGVSLLLRDGTGKQGEIAVISDSSLTTVSAVTNAATAYLAQYGRALRGELEVTDHAAYSGAQAGGIVEITDARLGLSAQDYRVMQIDKSFLPSGRENWHVTYGGLAPAMSRHVRRLTRPILS